MNAAPKPRIGWSLFEGLTITAMAEGFAFALRQCSAGCLASRWLLSVIQSEPSPGAVLVSADAVLSADETAKREAVLRPEIFRNSRRVGSLFIG